MSTLSQFDPKGIKSNQSGSATVGTTVTISPVNTAKSFVILEGVLTSTGYNMARVSLTNSTTVTITAGGFNQVGTAYWRVIELY